MTIDSSGTMYVSPTGTLVVPPGQPGAAPVTPLWRSRDGGSTWDGPLTVPNIGPANVGLGGADADVMVDSAGRLYVTSLWIGNTSGAVSADGGDTWTASPWSHVSPVDDRPWFAYDPHADAIYMVYDGVGGLHVAKAVTRTAPVIGSGVGSVVLVQDIVAVPRAGLGTPGSLTVDPSGRVWLAFAEFDGGLAVTSSVDGGLTWAQNEVMPQGTVVPAGFPVIRSDGAGDVFLVWSQVVGAHSEVWYTAMAQGSTRWQQPTRVDNQANALFGTVAIGPGGVMYVTYYGTSEYGKDPNNAPASTAWSVYLSTFRTPLQRTTSNPVALREVHRGAICTMGVGCSSDRTLGDFFSIAIDPSGHPVIATMADQGKNARAVLILRM
ncbi:MAG: beta propeller repeat protein [Candidatus Dormibacteria bacterium]